MCREIVWCFYINYSSYHPFIFNTTGCQYFFSLDYWACSDDVIFITSFIGTAYPSYEHPFCLIVLSEKHKPICNFDNMSCPSVLLYLWLPCESSRWRFHIILFAASSSRRTISTLLWCFSGISLIGSSNKPVWSFSYTDFAYVCLVL